MINRSIKLKSNLNPKTVSRLQYTFSQRNFHTQTHDIYIYSENPYRQEKHKKKEWG